MLGKRGTGEVRQGQKRFRLEPRRDHACLQQSCLGLEGEWQETVWGPGLDPGKTISLHVTLPDTFLLGGRLCLLEIP